MSSPLVFHDPSGRRGRRVRAMVVASVSLALLLVGAVAIGVLQPSVGDPLPLAATPGAAAASSHPARPQECDVTPAGSARLRRCPPMPLPRQGGAPVADPIVAAFAVQWDAGSRAALRRVGDQLDWVIVEGAFLGRAATDEISIALDPDLLADARRRAVAVHLMLTNYGRTGFDSALVSTVVATPARRQHAVMQLTAAVRTHGLQGITIDFELVPPDAHPQVLAFLGELRAALASDGVVLSVAVPVSEGDGYPLRLYGEAVDYLIPMLYDEHSADNAPGPVASAPWFAATLDAVTSEVPAHKLLVGLGQYGYHWRSDRPEGMTVSVSEAMALGRGAVGGPAFGTATRNPSAEWRDANGVAHSVWYLDAVTAWNQTRASLATGAAGVAFWRLGSDDATLWQVLERGGMRGSADSLRRLPDNGVAVTTGDGEVLAVEAYHGTGERTLTMDTAGYIVAETLARPPGGYVVSRGGAHATRVALTFDDGPDPDFTALILDTLKAHGAVGSFFVVGRQVQHLPALARRLADEGHEIGNHSWSHADLSGLSDAAIRRELAATGQVIEAVTGRRPLLFRPPYIGDARPATEESLRPMAVAGALGYRVAGLEVDTKDWFETDAQAIVATAMRGVRRGAGRIILLHDAGGDRSPTVAAVGPLVDSLRAAGYELSTVAQLLNVPLSEGMTVAPASEAPHRALLLVALRLANAGEAVLVTVFAVALVMGLLRLILIGGLAAAQRFIPRYARRGRDASYRPPVSVLVPAYNEGEIIARTIRSVLAQQYPSLELLIIDDGSTDDTSDHARHASSDARLRVLRQPNGGKAAALNYGIAEAQGDVIVVIDADTLLDPDAILHLVRPLADVRVGAVAGNAKVGNRVNLVTRWQAVEYVTSQNLDRRAFVTLNCITVVPGAIGAWRRSAIQAVGGFQRDTMAEDQDLTLTLLRHGHRIALADRAIARTEAPETLGALLTQRFRWSFGTLQCAWKHRDALLRRDAGALGMIGLPNILLFQLFFPLLAPAADLALLATLGRFALEAPALGTHAAWGHAAPVLALYGLFLLIDTVTALLGLAFEPGERVAHAALVPLQRVAYRQVLYLALVKAMRAALRGRAPGWGKLERTGRVQEHVAVSLEPAVALT
ncbi:MAG: glycosyltransferase [Gemmatimonadaceae bacterium]|nr:glycosyltransferase [Gemmatimonadaceae bacterium]